jgi:uncharacterized protein DUF3551
MRLALIALVTVAAALATGVQLSSAQDSFFNARYCTRPGGTDTADRGIPDCAFNTWEQCIASARGLGR